jgi:N-methylhydantoinase A/oxoprolinase/acetone carboxylase beta subunit
MILRRVDALVADRLVLRAGFTPTDALHALGRLDLWNVQAAEMGARILAKLAGRSAKGLCEAVIRQVSDQAATALVTKVLSDENHVPHWQEEPTAALLLSRALDGDRASDLDFALTLRQPVVAIGAPVEAYMPRVAERLHTDLAIPQHAEVANAVGAVAGGVVQRRRATITPLEGGEAFRLHLPQGVRDFSEVEDAVAYAWKEMEPWVADQARQAGAAQVEVHMSRHDRAALVKAGWGDRIYLGSELVFTATGRPSPAVRED